MLNAKAGVGLAGHSYGAAGVSYIAQWDPRVKAVVAWDNLGGPGPEAGSVPSQQGGTPPMSSIGEKPCPADPADRTVVPITKPGLGMSADYGLPPLPNTGLPEPLAKSKESLAYSEAGVDTGEIIIRGGSHLDFSFIPNQAFGASLRGPDEIAWYTTAWFDKYVKHQASADKRLLTERWREDPVEAAVDPNHDGNAFSFYYLSRLDIHLAKRRNVRLRGHARRLPGDGADAQGRLPRQLLLPGGRHLARRLSAASDSIARRAMGAEAEGAGTARPAIGNGAGERVERAVLRTLLALPEPVKRRLAGAPLRRDGLTLDLETQLLLRLAERDPEPPLRYAHAGAGARAAAGLGGPRRRPPARDGRGAPADRRGRRRIAAGAALLARRGDRRREQRAGRLLPRRRLGRRRPRHARQRLPGARALLGRARAERRLPARSRAPVPGRRSKTRSPPTATRSRARASSGPTRGGSRSRATARAGTSRR